MTLEIALPDWASRLLGGDTAPSGEGTQWLFKASWPFPPWALLLLVACAIAWVWLLYAREGASLARRSRLLLASLRLGTLGVLLFMIGEAMLYGQRTGLPYVVVLVDTSASMDVADRYSNEKLRAQLEARLKKSNLEGLSRINLAKTLLLENDAETLARIDSDYKLKVYFMAGAATAQSGDLPKLVETIRAAEADGEVSRLGGAVRSVLGDLRGTPPAAIVVLSDGVTTEGEGLSEAAEYARRKGVPLFTIGIGDEEPVRDIRLADLLVDEVVFVDDVVNFQGTIVATGYAGREIEVTLREKDSYDILARTKVALGPDGEPVRLQLPYRPTKVDKYEYIVEVAPQADEADTQNNLREKTIDVRKEQIRVLFVQAYPNYEFRYLKTMLQRDPTIELKTVLQEADLEYASFDETALRVFPVQRDELFKYDVILFGDVNPDPVLLSASTMQNLLDFVQQKGGGIAFLAGPRYTPLAFIDTPLATLFPIDLNAANAPSPDEVLTESFQPVPTDLGLSSPHMQLGDTLAETAKLWQNLPPLYWLLEVPHLKPAARVLATHPIRLAADGRKLPVFIMQYVGAGKVLFHATDETWRWRFRIGDVLFARYWIQTIRYLAHSKLLGGERSAQLTVDREEYVRGEAVRVRVQFLDDRLAPAADDGVTVMIEGHGRKSRRMKLERTATARGIFEGTFTGAAQGNYHAWMVTPSLEGRAPAADFRVAAPRGETERTQIDVAELARAAERSRGKFYRFAQAGRLLDDLPEGRQVPIETLPPQVIWNRWWVLTAFLGLLVGEWILRKRHGLL